MSTTRDSVFIKSVRSYHARHGRDSLPWRHTTAPYRILVSEVMLQQTQVERVIPKYQAFLKQFPTVKALARAPLSDVLIAWQGLGYNRRAKMLHACASVVMTQHKGRFPKTYTELLALPGIGSYTAGAVMAFAYNESVPIIETNIRTAILHHYFSDARDVSDRDIMEIVERTLPRTDARVWYAALMDYGAYLKRTIGNQNHKSATYKKQAPFKGSDRQLRGVLLRQLATSPRGFTAYQLAKMTDSFSNERLKVQVARLLTEGLLTKEGKYYRLPH